MTKLDRWCWIPTNPNAEDRSSQRRELRPEELESDELRPEELESDDLRPEDLRSEELRPDELGPDELGHCTQAKPAKARTDFASVYYQVIRTVTIMTV